MTVIQRSSLVPYRAQQMYVLVNDIDAYVQFLPWCNASKILTTSPAEITASIGIAQGPLQHTFTTCNRLTPHSKIELQLVEGPFKQLHGEWLFQALGEQGCKISLELHFEFSNRFTQAVVNPVFGRITNSLVDSFCRRAGELYGKQD